jgi:hypothetical protein
VNFEILEVPNERALFILNSTYSPDTAARVTICNRGPGRVGGMDGKRSGAGGNEVAGSERREKIKRNYRKS